MHDPITRRTVDLGLLGLVLAFTVGADPTPATPRYASALIPDVPHVRQKPDFCGEAAVESWLRHQGHDLTQDDVFDATGLEPGLARGAWTPDLRTALVSLGIDPGPTWYDVAAKDATAQLASQWEALHADLVAGVPSLVCMHYSDRPRTTEHFRLILGYDADSDEVIYHEPAEDEGAYRRMDRRRFLALWPLKYDVATWTVIRLRLPRGPIRGRHAASLTAADFTQHAMDLGPRVPAGFTTLLVPPFWVLGDESAETVQRRAEGTVKWAVERLQADFFANTPAEVWEIWLFKSAKSYEHHAWELWRDRPDTPYGYASSTHRALVMNIATGGGTLVHEIVHPFLDANFPGVPSWFNEGLASLYEQCGDRGGHIVGFTNWRLAGLQRAIAAGTVPSFKTLTHTTTSEFYNADPGTNYAQARYLLYWLQEHGKLRSYYRDFHAARASDPTGYATLQSTVGAEDMHAWQTEWERWVAGLRFEG